MIIRFIERKWTDPVWSKVFAAGICAIATGIFTWIWSLIKNIPLAEIYHNLNTQKASISYLWIIIISIVLLSLIIPMISLGIISFQLKNLKIPARLKTGAFDLEALVNGIWQCSYRPNIHRPWGSETALIKQGNKYFIDGRLYFVLTDIDYNPDTNTISWTKTSYPQTTKHTRETLKISSKTLLEGSDDYNNIIKYEKLQ